MAKSDEAGGLRSTGNERGQIRHGVDNLGAMGFAWLALNRIDALDATEKMVLMGGLTVLGSSVLKAWSSFGMTQRISKLIDKAAPLALVCAFLLSGCAIQLGRATPQEFEGKYGETIIACEVVGISMAFGDADICRNTEGGHISEFFKDMVLGITDAAIRIVGGVFTGVGGIGAAIQAQPAVAAPAPAAVAPEPVSEESAGLFD